MLLYAGYGNTAGHGPVAVAPPAEQRSMWSAQLRDAPRHCRQLVVIDGWAARAARGADASSVGRVDVAVDAEPRTAGAASGSAPSRWMTPVRHGASPSCPTSTTPRCRRAAAAVVVAWNTFVLDDTRAHPYPAWWCCTSGSWAHPLGLLPALMVQMSRLRSPASCRAICTHRARRRPHTGARRPKRAGPQAGDAGAARGGNGRSAGCSSECDHREHDQEICDSPAYCRTTLLGRPTRCGRASRCRPAAAHPGVFAGERIVNGAAVDVRWNGAHTGGPQAAQPVLLRPRPPQRARPSARAAFARRSRVCTVALSA